MKRTHTLIAQLVGFVAGIGKHYATPVTLTINQASVSTADLATQFQAVVDADAAARAEEAKRTALVNTANSMAEAVLPSAKAFKQFVLLSFGNNTATLADFDVKPRKVAVVPTAVKSAAAKKAAATRKALGTKGSLQKKLAKQALAEQAVPAAPAFEPAPVAEPTPPKA